MGTIASQITSLTSVYSTVCSGADQRKHQSCASLAFVWGIHRCPVNSPHKWPVARKMFPYDDVIVRHTVFLSRVSYNVFLIPTVPYASQSCPGASCHGRCGQSFTEDHRLCSCDRRCQSLGDCCLDFSTKCAGLVPSDPTTRYDTMNTLAFLEDTSQVTSYMTSVALPIKVAHSCPETSRFSKLCTDGILDPVALRLCHPKQQLLFANQFCAYCNGYLIDELVPFEIAVSPACNERIANETMTSRSQLPDWVAQDCLQPLHQYVPHACRAAVYRNLAYTQRDDLMCKSHLNPVVAIKGILLFRNGYCAPPGADTECFDGNFSEKVPMTKSDITYFVSFGNTGTLVLRTRMVSAAGPHSKYLCVDLVLMTFATLLLPYCR